MNPKELQKQINDDFNKYGSFMYFDIRDFSRPIVINKTAYAANVDLIKFVQQNKKYVNKKFALVILGFSDKDLDVEINYVVVSNDFTVKQVEDIGNIVSYKIDYIRKYGFHLSDLKHIHDAFMKEKSFSVKFVPITIEKIYKSLGIKPKKVKTKLEFIYPVVFDNMIENTKEKLKKNGQYRFYVPYYFDTPAVATASKESAKDKMIKHLKKYEYDTNIVFYVEIHLNEKTHEITVKCQEYSVSDELKFNKRKNGTTVIFTEEYLMQYGFRFIDIERIYFALIKHPELSTKKSVTITEISDLAREWMHTIMQTGYIC
jgi:hypothetical protein